VLGGHRHIGEPLRPVMTLERRGASLQGALRSQARSNLATAQLRHPRFGQAKSADLERAEGSTGGSPCVPRASLTVDPRRC
jgi:hypothetical protein